MIRVVYTWRVEPQNFEKFKEMWRATTNGIHESVEGALGSFMLQSFEDKTEVITVAKWKSVQQWQEFWGSKNPKQMQSMRDLGERLSVEVFEEIEDHTR